MHVPEREGGLFLSLQEWCFYSLVLRLVLHALENVLTWQGIVHGQLDKF